MPTNASTSGPTKVTTDWNDIAARWQPIPKSPTYALGIFSIGLAIVVMITLYLAIIAGAAYFVYWYTTHIAVPSPRGGRAAVASLIAWVVPIITGGVIVALLLKPIFAPRSQEQESIEITPGEEPRLFAFVESVCRAIGAPVPRKIILDADVNASASFTNGALSLFRSGDLTLRIGMPLVAALNRRQFAGIMAHEFGHFAQGVGMRITYVGQRIINWFMRIAYQRDAWDDAIAAVGQIHGVLAIASLLVQLLVFLTRILLIVIATVGAAICFFMLRQMEFDADRYQAQLVGSSQVGATAARLASLSAAAPRAMEESRRMFTTGGRKLPNNLPAMVALAERRMTPEEREERYNEMLDHRTSWFDTHPKWRARIASAEKLESPGLYTEESPAAGLFGDFHGACVKATFGAFEGILGGTVREATFVPVANAESVTTSTSAASDPARSYLGFDLPSWRPLWITARGIPDADDGREIITRLRAARSEHKRLAPAAAAQVEVYRKASEQKLKYEHARHLMDGNLRPDFRAMGIKDTSREGISRAVELAIEQLATSAPAIDDASDAARARITSALSLLGVRGIEKYVATASALRKEAEALMAASRALADMQPWAMDVRESLARVRALGPAVKKRADSERAIEMMRPLSDRVRDRMADARARGGECFDPLTPQAEGSYEKPNLGSTLVGASPGWREYDEIFAAGELFVDRWADHHRRVLARLCEIAEQVERGLSAAAQKPAAAKA